MIDLLYLACTVLLPIIPAFLLFKALGSQGDVGGPLLGLKIKLSGAFAGYFAVLVLIFVMYNVWHPTYKVWKVHGQVTDESGAAIEPLEDKDVILIPGTYTAYPDGGFDLTFAAVPGDYPRLTISHASFQAVTRVLDPKSADLKDQGNGHLMLQKISLRRLPAYSASGAPPAALPANQEPAPARGEDRP